MIDRATLKSLFDDEALVRKYIDCFAEDMPVLLRMMQKKFETHQWDELSIHAHSYKTQMQYINESVAADLAYTIEKFSAASSPEPNPIGELIQQLQDHLNSLLPALKQLNE